MRWDSIISFPKGELKGWEIKVKIVHLILSTWLKNSTAWTFGIKYHLIHSDESFYRPLMKVWMSTIFANWVSLCQIRNDEHGIVSTCKKLWLTWLIQSLSNSSVWAEAELSCLNHEMLLFPMAICLIHYTHLQNMQQSPLLHNHNTLPWYSQLVIVCDHVKSIISIQWE